MSKTISLGIAELVLRDEKRIFGAKYIKANGEVTKINGRFGVHKFLRGTGQSKSGVWTVWDNNRKRYTSLVPDRIVEITYAGHKYQVEQ
jgi:hypothetical protein